MKFTRTVAYAVQAVLSLAQASGDRPVSCSRLAAEGHMPERFLLQILRTLVTHGILHSTRGVEGGYQLNRSAAEISLLDVIEAIEGPTNATIDVDQQAAARYGARLAAVLARARRARPRFAGRFAQRQDDRAVARGIFASDTKFPFAFMPAYFRPVHAARLKRSRPEMNVHERKSGMKSSRRGMNWGMQRAGLGWQQAPV
jgi:Rrf2 family protein